MKEGKDRGCPSANCRGRVRKKRAERIPWEFPIADILLGGKASEEKSTGENENFKMTFLLIG